MIQLLILLVVLGLAGCVLVLPVAAFLRTRQIPGLLHRLDRVERELRRLRRWAVYAGVLLALGFRLESVPLRWTALGLLGVTLAKVILVDMAGLPGIYRVVAFFILSLVMGAAAWGYQKLEATRRPAQREVVGHAKV
jgi:hypothetical protein